MATRMLRDFYVGTATLMLIAPLTLTSTIRASAATIVDNSADLMSSQQGLFLTSFWSFQKFSLAETTSLTNLSIWLRDGTTLNNNDGILNDFSGTLSWQIVQDAAGSPTSDSICAGVNSSVVLTDSGIQSLSNSDVVRADLEIGGVLPPGTYWIGLHENSWTSEYDGSQIEWYRTLGNRGGAVAQGEGPNGPFNTFNSLRTMMVLSGVVVPEPSTAVFLAVGLAGLSANRSRQ